MENKIKDELPSFLYDIDKATGEKIYRDPNVQLVYINLGRLGDFTTLCQIKSELEYTNVCQNLSQDGKTDTALDFLINLMTGSIEFMGDINFPWVGKTGGKIASWIINGIIDTYREQTPDDLQNDFNEVWDGIKTMFDTIKLDLDKRREDMEKYWFEKYTDPKSGNSASISMLSQNGYLPEPNTTEFDEGAIFVANKSVYWMTMKILPIKWNIVKYGKRVMDLQYYHRWNSNYDWQGPISCDGNYDCDYGCGMECGDQVHSDHNIVKCIECWQKANIDPTGKASHFWTEKYDRGFEHNLFTDDRLYCGLMLHTWELREKGSNPYGVPQDSMLHWLFIDDSNGNTLNSNGVTRRDDFFRNWPIERIGDESVVNPIKKKTVVRKIKSTLIKIFGCGCKHKIK